jgi:hypothetical protein
LGDEAALIVFKAPRRSVRLPVTPAVLTLTSVAVLTVIVVGAANKEELHRERDAMDKQTPIYLVRFEKLMVVLRFIALLSVIWLLTRGPLREGFSSIVVVKFTYSDFFFCNCIFGF